MMTLTKRELVGECIKYITEDIGIMSEERNFLRNLLIQIEIYYGLCLHKYDNTQSYNIQKVMNFIVRHRVVSISDLMQEFLGHMTESELDMIINALTASKFIQFEDALIKYREELR